MPPVTLFATILLLFALSGFAGLIYESIWSHYLKLFLGHAAYAQTLVLSIFMGGMALGSWFAGRTSARWSNLLLAYAAVEGVIGLLGVVFHGTFVRVTDFAYDVALPAIEIPSLAHSFKWALGILLILPQSVLLGMTFPLMSGGLIRRFPATPGATLAMLYFTNSIGAAIGVLVSGFVLIDIVGLPGTILTAGLINIALAIVVWALLKTQPPEVPIAPKSQATEPTERGWFRLMLLVAMVTGLSSFMYEIGWIRMLVLVLGASTHAFELMLSAFILGLALGSLWIRKRIDQFQSPVRVLANVQIIMGGCALLSLPLYGYTFDVMQWLLQSVSRNVGGYQLFNLTSHLLAMVVMLPATFCAGMTLPLITYTLLNRGHGEKSIGSVYAANTAGAIVGIATAVHLMPVLALKGVIVAGATLDILLALLLIWYASGHNAVERRTVLAGFALMGFILIIGIGGFSGLDPLKAASGVFRHGVLFKKDGHTHVLFHEDGKTASVDLLLTGSSLSIRTNGKSDAAVELDKTKGASPDEPTMILTALLPMMHLPEARSVAVIGIGSGLTSHAFLTNPMIARVDSIEIESAMVRGAEAFRPRTDSVYTDPRSKIHIEDAKTFFAVGNRRYDIIASEPSNPWVSGVASLFTDEFYRRIKTHLNDNGVFAQWIQIYEIDRALVTTVIKALSAHFPEYVIYTPTKLDLILLARKSGSLRIPDAGLLMLPALAGDLGRIGISTLQDVELRRLGSKRTLDPLFVSSKVPRNSDYFPLLDQNAARTRFLGRTASEVVDLANVSLPLLEMLGEPPVPRDHTRANSTSVLTRTQLVNTAIALRDYFAPDPRNGRSATLSGLGLRDAEIIRMLMKDCTNLARSVYWTDIVFDMAQVVNSHLTRVEARQFWDGIGIDRCASKLTENQRTWLSLYRAVGARDADSMARRAESLLTKSRGLNQKQINYLVVAGMLGHIANGARERARTLLEQHVGKIPGGIQSELALELLELHSRPPGSETVAIAR